MVYICNQRDLYISDLLALSLSIVVYQNATRIKKALLSERKQGFCEATQTGLEPATSGSTVRDSNQLSYCAV